jgi:hypothetical protein
VGRKAWGGVNEYMASQHCSSFHKKQISQISRTDGKEKKKTDVDERSGMKNKERKYDYGGRACQKNIRDIHGNFF